jgi:hypothetical protein
VPRIRRGGGLHASVSDVGLKRVAGDLVEEPAVDTLAPPVCQAIPGLVANGERDALLGHLAAGAHSMSKLINRHVLRVGDQRLFVSFQGGITLDASALKLLSDAEGNRGRRDPC